MKRNCLSCIHYKIDKELISSCRSIIMDPYDTKPCSGYARSSYIHALLNKRALRLQKQKGVKV